MESKTGANSDTRSNFQLRHGEPSEGRDKEDQSTIARVRSSRRRQRVLLVPEPEIKKQAQAPPSPKLENPKQPSSCHCRRRRTFILVIVLFRKIISQTTLQEHHHHNHLDGLSKCLGQQPDLFSVPQWNFSRTAFLLPGATDRWVFVFGAVKCGSSTRKHGRTLHQSLAQWDNQPWGSEERSRRESHESPSSAGFYCHHSHSYPSLHNYCCYCFIPHQPNSR